MQHRNRTLLVCLVFVSASLANAAEPKEAKIKRALSSAPAYVAQGARVVDMDEKGNMTVLREGHTGITCIPGHLGVVSDTPACVDAAGLQWLLDWMAHKPKPTNTQPGIIYQSAGGTDWSASDPWATSGTVQHWPPGYVIAWPFDPKTTGFSDKPKNTGSWIMWAGTPYAHLMINQKP
jgi:hypothetical protein